MIRTGLAVNFLNISYFMYHTQGLVKPVGAATGVDTGDHQKVLMLYILLCVSIDPPLPAAARRCTCAAPPTTLTVVITAVITVVKTCR